MFNYIVQRPDGKWELRDGIAMGLVRLIDGTGSMGGNVDLGFKAQPRLEPLLPIVLPRYQVQKSMGVYQDVSDRCPLQIAQLEPDIEHDRQMALLAPEHGGGAPWVDPEVAMWYLAFRLSGHIWDYGLKPYAFIIGDEKGRDELELWLMEKVFGSKGPELLNLHEVRDAKGIAAAALKKWHMFFLQVTGEPYTTRWFSDVLGRERTVIVPTIGWISEIMATIIGLSEGVLDLQNAVDFLMEHKTNNTISRADARQIVRAVGHIPLRAQADLPGFNKIPLPGSVFTSKDDVWPTELSEGKPSEVVGSVPGSNGEEIAWQL
ncbi:MAG: hypothetical protein Q7S03_01190 [bacterium]|nr:hypothetical protein [bacterium]